MELNTEKMINEGINHVFQAGDVIFREGDDGDAMYLIITEEVEISVNTSGGSVVVDRLADGDIFGEMSLLVDLPRSATAKATKTSKLVSFTKEQLLNYVQNERGFAWKLLTKLSGRIRRQNRRLAESVSTELKTVSEQLNKNMLSMNEKIEKMSFYSREIEKNERELVNHIKEVEEITKEVNRTLNLITQIANQIKILGFNATIEAARSGEHGQGFKVVAKEMTKLSELSRENAEMIKKLSAQIAEKMTAVTKSSEKSMIETQSQAKITEEMVEDAKNVSELSETLVTISRSITEGRM